MIGGTYLEHSFNTPLRACYSLLRFCDRTFQILYRIELTERCSPSAPTAADFFVYQVQQIAGNNLYSIDDLGGILWLTFAIYFS